MISATTKSRGVFFVTTLLLITIPATGFTKETPSLCLLDEEVYFSCLMKNGKILSLCGNSSNPTEAIQYRYGKKNNLELTFPNDMLNSREKFTYNSYFRYSADYFRVSFLSDQYYYRIYRDIDSESSPELKAGVIVEIKSNTNKKEFNLPCTSNIKENLSKLPSFLECDKESALGCAN